MSASDGPSQVVAVELQATDATSQTAQEYISTQLQLEAEAKEALPYQFDSCTKPLGPLRQSLFSCLTCNPATLSASDPYTPAGVCYSCSISCHGEHELVELFTKRNFECDCGTTRIQSAAPCTLRAHPDTGMKGFVSGEAPRTENRYNQNYSGRFCACGEVYDHTKEKGTMFQCLGLGTADDGGCGEDWWHPECLLGLPRPTHVTDETPSKQNNARAAGAILDAVEEEPRQEDVADTAEHDVGARAAPLEHPLPTGFPAEDDFDHIICYKCIDKEPWLKQYAGTAGFLPAVFLKTSGEAGPVAQTSPSTDMSDAANSAPLAGTKRKAEDEEESGAGAQKKAKSDDNAQTANGHQPDEAPSQPKHQVLPQAPAGEMSLFLKEDFRDHFCRCAECFPRLKHYPQLLEEEDSYEPPLSESDPGEGNGTGSVGSRSLLDRGEAALSTMDRMRAIEGVMAYNHLKDRVKAFLQPFAESGQTVGAEDVKAYFAKLRGDEDAQRAGAASADKNGADDAGADGRHEQSGY